MWKTEDGPEDEECRWHLDFGRNRILPRASQKEHTLILRLCVVQDHRNAVTWTVKESTKQQDEKSVLEASTLLAIHNKTVGHEHI